MNSKTSLFNKSIIKSDVKRLWWVCALYTLAVFFTFTFSFIRNFYNNYVNNYDPAEYIYSPVMRNASPLWFFSFIFPVVLGVLLFSYVQSGRASTFAHSIPVSRKSLYLSHLLSGVVMVLIPLLLNTALLVLIKLNPEFKEIYRISHVLTAMSTALSYALVAFSGAAFVSFIMGNTVASLIFTYVFGALPLFIQVFIAYFSEQQLYGYVYNGNYEILEYIYLSPHKLMEVKYVLFYLLLSVILAVLGYFIYKIRHIENHSEIVGFPKLKPVFVLGAGIFAGCVGYVYFNNFFNMNSVLWIIPFGILGIIIAKMIVKKSFRVFEAYKPILGFLVFALCLHLIFTYDLTGYENRIPELNTVESVEFDNGINTYYASDVDFKGSHITYKFYELPVLSKQEDIQNVINLHKELISNRYNDKNGKPYLTTVSYKLKNGKTLTRTYNIDPEIYLAKLEPVVEAKEIRQTYFPILRDSERITTQLEIHDERIAGGIYKTGYVNDNTDIMTEFLTALKKDLAVAKGREYAKRDHTLTYITIKFKLPATYEGSNKEVPFDNIRERSETYYIRASYKNTIALLDKYGLYDVLPTVQDILKVGVEYYDLGYSVEETTEVALSDRTYRFHEIFEDLDDIKEIYEYIMSDTFSPYNSNASVTFFTKDHSFTLPFETNKDDLPKILKHP